MTARFGGRLRICTAQANAGEALGAGIVEALWLMAMLPDQDIFDLSCVVYVVLRCAHLVSQNECTPRWLSWPMQIQS